MERTSFPFLASLACQKVLAGKMFIVYYTCLELLLNCQCCFKFWGCSSSTCTFEKILFLHLGLTVTEINTKKYRNKKIKNIKNVGMACQKVCKQGRDDVCMYVNKGQTPWQTPMPTSFSHYSWIVHESYLVAI